MQTSTHILKCRVCMTTLHHSLLLFYFILLWFLTLFDNVLFLLAFYVGVIISAQMLVALLENMLRGHLMIQKLL